jgi:uncharacterized OB-fold protein
MKELTELQEIVNTIKNDNDLGIKIREYFHKLNRDTNNFTKCIHCGIYQPDISYTCKHCKKPIHEE